MRNKSLDAVKAIAACLVVCIHVSFPGQAGQLVKVLARCAVPFFFMVSGYFCYYQNCNASKRILSKILHIMKLFAVSVVFYFIWECFMKAWNGERVWTWIRMRKAAYCMAPVLLAILLWRAEFCVFFDRFYHTMEYRNFLFTGMSFFLTGQMIHEYQDKIVCKRLEQWMQWGLKAGMIFGVALSMMEYAFRGAGEIYTGNCVAVICLFLWLILYGREINFPSVLVETGRKYAFLIYLLHPAVSDLLKKCSEGLGVSNCQIYFWLRPVLVYMLTVVTVSGISAVSAYARQNILQNNHV